LAGKLDNNFTSSFHHFGGLW